MKKVVIADDFGINYVTFENPNTKEEINISGEIVSGYYHKNTDGTFDKRKWFQKDITHYLLHEEEDFIVLGRLG